MTCEIFFDINGPQDEQKAITLKIHRFLRELADKGDIAGLDDDSLEVD